MHDSIWLERESAVTMTTVAFPAMTLPEHDSIAWMAITEKAIRYDNAPYVAKETISMTSKHTNDMVKNLKWDHSD